MPGKKRPRVRFHYLDVKPSLRQRRKLAQFVESMFKKEHTPLFSLDYIFCKDSYLLDLNKKFLHHNTYTDVITFLLSDPVKPTIGEIYISIDRVKENAIIYKTNFKSELHRVMFHGALHLCGYADKTKGQKSIIRSREDFYLKTYLVSRETDWSPY